MKLLEVIRNRAELHRNQRPTAPTREQQLQHTFKGLTGGKWESEDNTQIVDTLAGTGHTRGSDQSKTKYSSATERPITVNEPQQRPTKTDDAFANQPTHRSKNLKILGNARTPAPLSKRRREAGVSEWSASTGSSPVEKSTIKANTIKKHREQALDRLEGTIGAKVVSLPGEARPSAKRRLTPYPGTSIGNPHELERPVPRRQVTTSTWSKSTASASSESNAPSSREPSAVLGTATPLVITFQKPQPLNLGAGATSVKSQNLPDQVAERGYDLRPPIRGR